MMVRKFGSEEFQVQSAPEANSRASWMHPSPHKAVEEGAAPPPEHFLVLFSGQLFIPRSPWSGDK
jgi:hypothetical protein